MGLVHKKNYLETLFINKIDVFLSHDSKIIKPIFLLLTKADPVAMCKERLGTARDVANCLVEMGLQPPGTSGNTRRPEVCLTLICHSPEGQLPAPALMMSVE